MAGVVPVTVRHTQVATCGTATTQSLPAATAVLIASVLIPVVVVSTTPASTSRALG